MLYLLDTNVISDLMEDDPPTTRRARDCQEQSVLTCSVVMGEILYGIEKLDHGRRRETLERKAAEVFSKLRCEPVSKECAEQYSKIKCARRKAGLSLDENDLWIAATAKALGAILVTRDGGLKGTEGLTIENWSQPP